MAQRVRNKPTFDEEEHFWQQGHEYVLGVDEVGRGAFAGPVVAAGVIFDKVCLSFWRDKAHELSSFFNRINDSKKITPKIREELSEKIKQHSLYHIITEIDVTTINKVGIGEATNLAIRTVCSLLRLQIKQKNMFLLVDGLPIKFIDGYAQKAIIKGDQKSISIAAASIIAKVYRDEVMRQLAKDYPAYGFDIHKGYGTKKHQEAIFTHGLSQIHRTSFDLRQFLPKGV